jgi:methyl-accepting chemotaxis protein
VCTVETTRAAFNQVDELLEENEQLVVDIDKHQQEKSKSKAKQKESLVQAEKKIQQLNRNTHEIVALYKKLAQAAAKAGKKETG